ncbi:odorant receptor 131-2-like [Takifugu flavidus]|uniref:odorant receptor 131-2-like n=1 Tax=Takifugu flavidus TaxID=433684 RepID=UPI002544C7B9|nr:odorant receptor 131-2-like [Takifugu flavidus]
MSDNASVAGGVSLRVLIFERIIITQLIVSIFVSVNLFLIATVFSNQVFLSTMRYILFVITLVSDSVFLIIANLLLILYTIYFTMQVSLCIVFYLIVCLSIFVTPVTLTAMTLERYVAICLPLRHPELCSLHNTQKCILIILTVSSVPCFIILSTFFAAASSSVYTQHKLCSMEMFVSIPWQNHFNFAVYQFYFFIMSITITFSYVKIMKVAKAASGENKKSTWKGLSTVILHAFQLLLCLIQLWCPFLESAVYDIDINIFVKIRFFNYIVFNITSRCLSPLIYGLRDEKFFLTLKVNVFFLCCRNKRSSLVS